MKGMLASTIDTTLAAAIGASLLSALGLMAGIIKMFYRNERAGLLKQNEEERARTLEEHRRANEAVEMTIKLQESLKTANVTIANLQQQRAISEDKRGNG